MFGQLIAISIIAFLVGGFLFYHISRWWARWKLNRRLKHGVRSEAKAEGILKRHGYQVTAIQKSTKLSMVIDGKRHIYEVRPDAIAKKKKKLYFVEVKTGKRAIDPLFRETRRQLLEYYHSMPVDGVLLVNADAETVQHIQFGRRAMTPASSLLGKLFIAFLLGVALTAWLLL